jgi:hypothetical protein
MSYRQFVPRSLVVAIRLSDNLFRDIGVNKQCDRSRQVIVSTGVQDDDERV